MPFNQFTAAVSPPVSRILTNTSKFLTAQAAVSLLAQPVKGPLLSTTFRIVVTDGMFVTLVRLSLHA